VALLLGLASALWSCHAAGLVHLDVKPRNVGISSSGRATLLDFGLARANRQALVHKLPAGTLPYSAPELVRDGQVGPPTDVWGLGLLAHILLTGAYPGRRPKTWGELFRRGAVQPPPLASVRPDMPTSVSSVIDDALSIDPACRPANGQEVFEALLGAANIGFGAGWQGDSQYGFSAPGAAEPSAHSD
jgi:serine/threonine-protein kinase